MNFPKLAVLAFTLALSACVAPVGPVEVTRFHLPDTTMLGRGPVSVEPAPGMEGDSLEWRTYAAAVGRQLTLVGYTEQPAGTGSQLALVQLRRQSYRPERNRSPVSVGAGGSTGTFGSGVGLGLGFDLSGPPAEVVETELAVTIKDRASDQAVWEGRARFVVTAKSPLANSQLGAAKMAEALFKDFPGRSGETIEVK
jgi:hypothetical protein